MKQTKSIKVAKRRVKASVEVTPKDVIKVRLDYRTFITISKLSALKSWITRYPEASVMKNLPSSN